MELLPILSKSSARTLLRTDVSLTNSGVIGQEISSKRGKCKATDGTHKYLNLLSAKSKL